MTVRSLMGPDALTEVPASVLAQLCMWQVLRPTISTDALVWHPDKSMHACTHAGTYVHAREGDRSRDETEIETERGQRL